MSARRVALGRVLLLGAVAFGTACQLIADLSPRHEGTAGSGATAGNAGNAGSGTNGGTGGAMSKGGTGGGVSGAGGSLGGSTARGGTAGSVSNGGDSGDSGSGAPGGGTSGDGGTGGSGVNGGTGNMGGTGGGAKGGTGGKGGTDNGGTGGSDNGGTSAGGMSGAGPEPEPPTPGTIVPALDGYLWAVSATGTTSHAYSYSILTPGLTACPVASDFESRGVSQTDDIPVLGDAGTAYQIDVWVKGVVGTRCYTGGTGLHVPEPVPTATGDNDTWYVGGTQADDSWWNTFELHVPSPAEVYYLNAFPRDYGVVAPATPPGPWCEKEATYAVNYRASFVAMGQTSLHLAVHSVNCHVYANCGPQDADITCSNPRTIDLSDMSPPGAVAQPLSSTINSEVHNLQWLYIDVTGVSVASP